MEDQSGWKGENPANRNTRKRKWRRINNIRTIIPREMSNLLSKTL